MPRINLLPVKDAKRIDKGNTEILIFACLSVLTWFFLYIWYVSVEGDIQELQTRLAQLQGDLGNVEKVVNLVEDFKKKTLVLERKVGIIEVLKKQKSGPAKMLADLADILTAQQKVWLVGMDEKDGKMTLHGGAMEQENISEFQVSLEQKSKFFHNVNLILVNSARINGTPYFEWVITCQTNYAAG